MEFGSSGRVYNKAEILAAIGREPTARYAIKDFKTTAIAPGAALITYRASMLLDSGGETVEFASQFALETDRRPLANGVPPRYADSVVRCGLKSPFAAAKEALLSRSERRQYVPGVRTRFMID